MPETRAVERAAHSCNDFAGSGALAFDRPDAGAERCLNCGWVKDCHHDWKREERPNGTLGVGYRCVTCGRTAYDKDGRCTPESPPTDYPPCTPRWAQFDGDSD